MAWQDWFTTTAYSTLLTKIKESINQAATGFASGTPTGLTDGAIRINPSTGKPEKYNAGAGSWDSHSGYIDGQADAAEADAIAWAKNLGWGSKYLTVANDTPLNTLSGGFYYVDISHPDGPGISGYMLSVSNPENNGYGAQMLSGRYSNKVFVRMGNNGYSQWYEIARKDLSVQTDGTGFDNTTHGNRGGGSLHSVATTGTAGFMSAADKAKEAARSYVKVTKSSDQTLVSGAYAAISWDSEVYDQGNHFSVGNPTQIVNIPSSAQKVKITGFFEFLYDDDFGTNRPFIYLKRINGDGSSSTLPVFYIDISLRQTFNFSFCEVIGAETKLELIVYQITGTSRTIFRGSADFEFS